MKEKFIPYHTHLIVKGYIYNPPMNEEKLNEFFIDLVESVNMKVVAGPTSVYVDDLGNEGMTGTVTLATSHASLHVWSEENPSLFHFDLYSCSKFDHKKVLDFIGDRFDMIDYKFWFIDRNDDFQLIDKN
jgi:S-adenosylmethionine/arginine decarboxylase-like enzyme